MKSRRELLQMGAAVLAMQAAQAQPSEITELSVVDLQRGLASGQWTAVQLVEKYSDGGDLSWAVDAVLDKRPAREARDELYVDRA